MCVFIKNDPVTLDTSLMLHVHWSHFSDTECAGWKLLTSRLQFLCYIGELTVTVPFEGASSSVSLCGECSSGILLCFRTAKARRSGCHQLTHTVCCEGGNWWCEGLAEVICHAAQSVFPLMTITRGRHYKIVTQNRISMLVKKKVAGIHILYGKDTLYKSRINISILCFRLYCNFFNITI